MKHLLVCITLLALAATLPAQQSARKAPPKSPPATASAAIGGKSITITYSSPRVRGREGKIFTKDGLISHDKTYPIWRAGANAATTLHTDADLDLGGLNVPKGEYTLYVDIANPDGWVLIVNKQTGQWGTKYDQADDLGRVKFHTTTSPTLAEDLKYTIRDLGGNKGELTLAWEHKRASVRFKVQ